MLKGVYTPGNELINSFLMPIPAEAGLIQCTIVREKGMTKIWPKYTLHLSDPQKTILMQSSKMKASATPHYRIEIKTGNEQLAAREDGGYLGRLRSNFSSSEFYLFDGGAKDDQKATTSTRRQYGTVIYTADLTKPKKPRKIHVYLPMIDKTGTRPTSWPDSELKKTNIGFEYQQ